MMRRLGALSCALAGLVAAQTPGSKRALAAPMMSVGEPLLGFARGAQGDSLYTVLGTGTRAHLGSPVSLPTGVLRIYLPPLEQYALLESRPGSPLAVWSLKNGSARTQQTPVRISRAFEQPDLVAFSPTGQSAVFYDAAGGLLQVVNGLPAEPRIARTVSTEERSVSLLALSDDGQILVAQFHNLGPYVVTNGTTWQMLATGVRPRAWTFLPHTHDLVVSDSVLNEISLLPAVDRAPLGLRVVAGNVTADWLATTSDGDELVAAASKTGEVWEIALASGGRSQTLRFPGAQNFDTMRDGHAFLLSSFPRLTVLRAAASELHAGH